MYTLLMVLKRLRFNKANNIMGTENKKYILTDQTIVFRGHTLYRVKAVRDFGCVKKGDIGGWIEKEENLSHDGDCWVDDEAKVYDNARVFDNAQVFACAYVFGYSKVFCDAQICGAARVYDNAQVFGYAKIYGNSCIFGNAYMCGYSELYGNAKIFGDSRVYDKTEVTDDARVFGNTMLDGYVFIGGDAVVKNNSDFFVFQNNWSSNRHFTYTKSNKMWKVGCFYGTSEQLIEKAYQDSELSGKMYEKYVKFVESL